MRRIILAVVLVMMPAGAAWAQRTPQPMVANYSSLADAIIALKQAEVDLVWSILDYHYRAAQTAMDSGDSAAAAAEMALFGNEGDNAVGGVRKRLVDSGHHHHHATPSADEEYETGYVVVTIAAKQEILAASTAMRQASSASARQEAWSQFETTVRGLMDAR